MTDDGGNASEMLVECCFTWRWVTGVTAEVRGLKLVSQLLEDRVSSTQSFDETSNPKRSPHLLSNITQELLDVSEL